MNVAIMVSMRMFVVMFPHPRQLKLEGSLFEMLYRNVRCASAAIYPIFLI
jgi:hypothetical protein